MQLAEYSHQHLLRASQRRQQAIEKIRQEYYMSTSSEATSQVYLFHRVQQIFISMGKQIARSSLYALYSRHEIPYSRSITRSSALSDALILTKVLNVVLIFPIIIIPTFVLLGLLSRKLEFVHPVDNLISIFSDHVPSARSRRDRVRRRRRACSEGEWGHRRHVGRTVLRQLTTEVGRADTDRGPPAVSQVREGVPRSETRRLPRTYRRVWCLRANVTAGHCGKYKLFNGEVSFI